MYYLPNRQKLVSAGCQSFISFFYNMSVFIRKVDTVALPLTGAEGKDGEHRAQSRW